MSSSALLGSDLIHLSHATLTNTHLVQATDAVSDPSILRCVLRLLGAVGARPQIECTAVCQQSNVCIASLRIALSDHQEPVLAKDGHRDIPLWVK